MKENFTASLAFVLKEEGGYVNDPRDRGGATNHGITLATFRNFYPGSTVEDLRNISLDKVAHIYSVGYWAPVRGDELPAGVDIMVFNMSVNSGPHRSIELLQKACDVTVDGVLGPKTLSAAAQDGIILSDLRDATEAFYRSLSNFTAFGRGWLARLDRCYTLATTMVKS